MQTNGNTQYIAGQRYLHLFFTPKQQGQNTFSGDCWIHHSTWGIQRVNLLISEYANINYVHRLDIIQEFTQKNDSSWTLGKDRFIVELSKIPSGGGSERLRDERMGKQLLRPGYS
ncbi:hypothetical protein ACQ86N_12535 [Puia sp. P3]|uniref:hypothetical protein n=1 Tax=Puia sp. P3 TaxID=3423952 RepID=UPI003D676A90